MATGFLWQLSQHSPVRGKHCLFPRRPGLLKIQPWVSGKVESSPEIQECLERNTSLTEAGTESLRPSPRLDIVSYIYKPNFSMWEMEAGRLQL